MRSTVPKEQLPLDCIVLVAPAAEQRQQETTLVAKRSIGSLHDHYGSLRARAQASGRTLQCGPARFAREEALVNLNEARNGATNNKDVARQLGALAAGASELKAKGSVHEWKSSFRARVYVCMGRCGGCHYGTMRSTREEALAD